MPAIDTEKTAPREAVHQVNKGRAKRVKKARHAVNNPAPPQAPPHGSTELEKGTPRGPAAPEPREFRPSGARREPEATPVQREVAQEKANLNKKGRSLPAQEKTVQRLAVLGALSDHFKSGKTEMDEQDAADLKRAAAEVDAEQAARKSGSGPGHPSATLLAHIPGIGGALDSAAHTAGHVIGEGAKKLEDLVGKGITEREGQLSPAPTNRAYATQAAKEIVDAPVQAVPAIYQIGAAGYEAAPLTPGDTSRARKLGKGLADNTPTGQLLVHGNPKKALKLAEEHPGDTVLSVAGGVAGLGRTLGAVGRIAPSSKVRAIFSQGREDLHVHGNVSEARKYSPNAFTQAVQKYGEKRTRAKERNPSELVEKRDGPAKVNQKLAKRVHASGAANEVLRRKARAKSKNIMQQAEAGMKGVKVKGRRLAPRQAVGIAGKHHEIMGLLAQKIVRRGHIVDDLVKYRDQIKAKAAELGDAMPLHERKTNEALVGAIDSALDDKNFTGHPEGWFDAAETYITHRHAADQELHAVGLLTDEQMAAKYLPALQVHEGVHFDPTTEKTGVKVKHEEALTRAGGIEKEVRKIQSDISHEALKGRVNGRARVRIQGQVEKLLNDAADLRKIAPDDDLGAISGRTRQAHALEVEAEDLKTKAAALSNGKRSINTAKLEALSVSLKAFEDRHAEAVKEAKALAPRKGERSFRQNWKDANGDAISAAEGEARLPEGAEDPGFLSHNPRRHGAGAYHQSYDVRPERDTAKRTGASVERGSNDNSWRAMTDDLVGATGKADAAKAWDRMAREFGVGPQGKPFRGHGAGKTAKEYAETVSEETGVEMVAVRQAPLHEQAKVVQKIIDSVGDVGDLADVDYGTIMERSLEAALNDGPGPYIVVPRSVLKEWKDIATGTKSVAAMKAMQVFSQNFRRTVLPLSPKWLAGNLIEASLRSLFYGHGPVDWLRGVKALKMLEEHNPEAFEEFTARTLGGRLYGSAGRQQLHRGAEQFPEGSKMRKIAHAGGVVSRTRFVRPVLGAVRKLQDGVFGMNEWLEDQFATAAIGAKVKSDIRATSDSLQSAIRVQQDAMKEYVEKGLTNTNRQADFADHLNEVLGRYNNHSPSERWMIQTFTPFWDWYRNALKFVLVTLPTKHPIKTGLIAATEETMQSEQENEGDYSVFQSGGLPGFLKGSIANKDGTRTTLQRYLPFGAFSDPVGSLGDLVLPQVSSQIAALGGRNWKGTPFTKGDGSTPNGLDFLKAIAYGTAASQIPGLSVAQRFREGAGSAYDDSTIFSPKVREGSRQSGGQVANKIFNPFFPVQPNSGKKKKAPGLADLLRGGSSVSDLSKATTGGAGDVSDLVKAMGG